MTFEEHLAKFDAYVVELGQHDWQFQYSDDNRVWTRGNANDTYLAKKATSSPYFKRAHTAYGDLHYRRGNKPYQEARQDLEATIQGIRDDICKEHVTALITN